MFVHLVCFAELSDLGNVVASERRRLVLVELSDVVCDEDGSEGAARVAVLLSWHAAIHSDHLHAVARLALVYQVVVGHDVD